VVFDSILGKPKTVGVHPGMGMSDRYVGDEALAKRLVLDLTNPIQKGVIKDWEGFDKLLKHTFNQLKIHSEEQPLLLGEGMFVPEPQRPKVAELCFEKFGDRGFFMATEAVLATYGAGRSTSLVIDFGDQKTEFVPVTEGTVSAILFNANKRLHLGGSNLTDELCRTLRMSGYNFNTQAERELVRTMKEQMCFVAQDFDEEMKKNQKRDLLYQMDK
jgi:actin-related protein